MTIKVLCVIEDADRPTVATFVGMHRAGIDLTVVCPRARKSNAELTEAGVAVLDI